MTETARTTEPRGPVFLKRGTYRVRRLRDAARLLPVLGILLWAVPVLWQSGTGEGVHSSNALIYIFGVWCVLVLAAFAVSRRLRSGGEGTPE